VRDPVQRPDAMCTRGAQNPLLGSSSLCSTRRGPYPMRLTSMLPLPVNTRRPVTLATVRVRRALLPAPAAVAAAMGAPQQRRRAGPHGPQPLQRLAAGVILASTLGAPNAAAASRTGSAVSSASATACSSPEEQEALRQEDALLDSAVAIQASEAGVVH
jgi:hypothetical protein